MNLVVCVSKYKNVGIMKKILTLLDNEHDCLYNTKRIEKGDE